MVYSYIQKIKTETYATVIDNHTINVNMQNKLNSISIQYDVQMADMKNQQQQLSNQVSQLKEELKTMSDTVNTIGQNIISLINISNRKRTFNELQD